MSGSPRSSKRRKIVDDDELSSSNHKRHKTSAGKLSEHSPIAPRTKSPDWNLAGIVDKAVSAESPYEYSSPESNSRSLSTPLTTPSRSSPTHDTSRSKYHIKDLSTFAKDLEQAANKAFPNQGLSRYASVKACLIRWEEDDIQEHMRVQPELERLCKVLENRYGFDTEIWHIPIIKPHHKLMGKALDFIEEFDGSDNLFIVYYAGHGTMNEHRQPVWSCRRDIKYASLDWSPIQSLFDKASSDVLLFLDCCDAASSATTSGNGVIETIAACGFRGKAPPPGRFSFTNTLVEVLEDWKIKPSFSAASLHTEILFQLKAKRPEKAGDDGPRFEWCSTPVHFIYSSDSNAPSIEPSRRALGNRKSSEGNDGQPEKTDPQTQTTSNDTQMVAHSDYSMEVGLLTKANPTGDLTVPHVLIFVALDESQEYLELEAWRRWLCGIPALAKYAVVQGVYKSYSTIIVLSIPIMIWDMLPGNPACCFIGYVTSLNLCPSLNLLEGSGSTSPDVLEPKRSPTPPTYSTTTSTSKNPGVAPSEWEVLLDSLDGGQTNLYNAIYGGPPSSPPDTTPLPQYNNRRGRASSGGELLVSNDIGGQNSSEPSTPYNHQHNQKFDSNDYENMPPRPYECTFPSCGSTFENRVDWIEHENLQHWEEAWKCSHAVGPDCVDIFYERDLYLLHLRTEHGMTDAGLVEKVLLANQISGHDYSQQFWCGFCNTFILRKNVDTINPRYERFNHIELHFLMRAAIARQSLEEIWDPVHLDSIAQETSREVKADKGNINNGFPPTPGVSGKWSCSDWTATTDVNPDDDLWDACSRLSVEDDVAEPASPSRDYVDQLSFIDRMC